MSSVAILAAVSDATSMTEAAGVTESRNPAATASDGRKISAFTTTRPKCDAGMRCLQISMAVSGITSPMATSLAPILKSPSAPTRWSPDRRRKDPMASACPVQAMTTGNG